MGRRKLSEEEKEQAILKRKEYTKQYYLKNKEKIIETAKKHYEKNKDSEEFKEKHRNWNRNHYHNNIEKMREYNKKQNKIDYEKHKEKRQKARRERYKNGEVLKLLKNNQSVECNGQTYYHITKGSLEKHAKLLEGKDIIFLNKRMYIKL